MAMFQWGLLGNFVVNSFRFLMGEFYPVFFSFMVLVAIQLILKGRLIKINGRIVIGGILLTMVLTTYLHYSTFYPQQGDWQSLSGEIYQLFRNELLMNQVTIPMGGGIIGAFLYYITLTFFGKNGTYFLLSLLFFISLFMIINIPFVDVAQSLRHFFKQVKYFFTQSIPDLDEIKQVVETYQDEDKVEDIETSESSTVETSNSEDTESSIKPVRSSHQPQKKKERKPILSKLFPDKRPKVDYSTDYQPAFDEEQPDFVPYDGPALTKKRTNDIILDLDYFDQDNPSTEDKSEKKRIAIETYESGQDESIDDAFDYSKQVVEIKTNDFEDSDGTEEAFSKSEPKAKEAEIEADPNEETNESVVFNQEASHWQEQASQSNHLTDDHLETTLASAENTSVSQPTSKKKTNKKRGKYQLPSKNLLTKIPPVDQSEEYERINENIDKLETTFKSFGVDAAVVKANLGPAVTKYEIEPAIGVKVSKIVSLSDDIALALAARDVRIEAPIPGKSLIGIEVPNTQVSPVSFWEVIDPALNSDKILEVPLGRDVSGTVCLADLSKMPHLLIAGATGSGKSVGMNVIIVSLLMKAKPEEVKFLMIDPKKVELTMYNDLPHLLSPVVTNPRKAAKALNNVVEEMERRYELFAATSVRNVDGYNDYIKQVNSEGQEQYELLPKIVVFIDELADLMLVASNEVETAIIRLAQMARAAGIHMIIATQRPSVDVITGIIKANVPSRLAFAVSSGTDSRTILDSVGAEKLLGRGDMLFQPMGLNKPVRVQGAYISDSEVERITDFIKDQREAEYDDSMIVTEETMEMANASEDEYFEEAVEMIKTMDTISISQLQRVYRIGYNRAARLVDDLEAMGFVSEADGSKPRQVLINE
ncbi:DNA translocase FtsK [Aerococcaceae bacterium DSM 111020]|nr:DNA translocase FtsK [Aerococcaceae bacterium DSM 111020]